MVDVAIVEMNYVIAIFFLIAGLNSDFLNFIYFTFRTVSLR